MHRGRSVSGNALFIHSVIIAIAVITTAIAAVVIAVVPAPVMVVIAAMVAVVMPAMPVIIIEIRNTAAEQYGGGHSEQHGCRLLHSTLP